MGIKLGDISPLGGVVTGQGLLGEGLAGLADSGMGMLIPASYLAKSQRDKRKRKREEESEDNRSVGGPKSTMRKGGKVKKMAKGGKVTRGDGCCMKGHTKGKMR